MLVLNKNVETLPPAVISHMEVHVYNFTNRQYIVFEARQNDSKFPAKR